MKFALLTIFFLFTFNDGRAGEEKSDKKKRASVETASIEQLHWLTGDWEGPIGDGVLEESWLRPRAGTVAAVVRLTKGGVTEFVELIKIEKTGKSLELRLNLFDSSLRPLSEKPQVLKLSEISEKSVTFLGSTKGSHRRLSYELVSEDLFAIRIITKDGEKIAIDLKRP
ncbi:MAG: DUF6265 family protein [Verrucomicrobiota bacterium]|nr:DUF6265 family protein [Verrucomicrobiota bacterium]